MKYDLKDFDVISVNQKPIEALENLLEIQQSRELTDGGEKRLRRFLLSCFLAIENQAVWGEDSPDNCIEDKLMLMLDNHSAIVNKRLVSACFVKLMSEIDFLSESPWRPKIMLFLDGQYMSGSYKEWKIDPKLQSHERIFKLVDTFREQERQFFAALTSVGNPDRLAHSRQLIMSTLNSRMGRAFTRPFLPDNIDSQIGLLFDAIQNYFEYKDTIEVIELFERVQQIVTGFKAILCQFGSLYSLKMAQEAVDGLLTLVEQDFAHNKAAQPALLSIEQRNKKYPLHLVDNEIKLGLIIRNSGPGYSYDTRVTVLANEDELEFAFSELNIGRLSPNEDNLLEFPARVITSLGEATIVVEALWKDYTGQEQICVAEVTIKAQRSDLNWQDLKQTDPYSLEPVANETELIGRRDVLNRLLASLKNENIGSSIIHGQKRVGKTSLAKALKSNLQDAGYITIYLEAGDYVDPKAKKTISRLGTKLCNKIIDADQRTKHIPMPSFEDALSPFTDFLDEVEKVAPDRRIVFLLDEFDELPLELYMRGETGDSFFLTLRSITSRRNIGFILVGGEKMTHIMDFQGDNLNKWSVVSVDYFSRQQDWADYIEIIQRPVQNILEFSGDALGFLHDLTAGNPYFTKLICRHIFQAAVNMRDCYVTQKEIEQILATALRETAKNTFQHFWEDGIFETEKATEKSIRRRRILIALSDLLVKQSPVTGRRIKEHPLVQNEASLESDLRDFVSRKVLQGKLNGGFQDHTFEFFVRFFYEWLHIRGIQDVISTFADLDAALRQRQQEEQLRVRPSELVELVQRWGAYRGQTFTEDRIRAWLEQFANVKEQRLMYKVLLHLRFYTNSYMRSRMKEVHEVVTRGLGQYKQYRQQKRPDILISYLDGPGKSGSSFAKLYADENRILSENVVELSRLGDVLQKKHDEISAVIFLDDFVGTGNQASENIQKLNEHVGNLIRQENIRLVFATIVTCNEGWDKVDASIEEYALPMETHYCELLKEDDFLFTEQSKIFSSSEERETAYEIALRYGKPLVRDNPIGYGGIGVALSFEHRCPNDTLPILWSEGTNPKWIPLFKRL
jgi:AAA+ ATPase superfamily predicted ATPase